jgi:colicin import membrane protein
MKSKELVVVIKPEDYGLTDETAKQISLQFQPMLDKMVELETEFNKIVKLPMDNSKMTLAKELRLKYVKVRTGTEAIHRAQKEFYLKGGKFVDGWKNAQIFASQGKEEKLKEIEEHEIRAEAERVKKLEAERVDLISGYLDEVGEAWHLGLGTMPNDVFEAYLSSKKKAHEARLQAEKDAEELRIANEKKEAEEKKKLREENDRLKAEQAKKDAIRAKENEDRRVAQEKLDAENKKIKEKADADAKAIKDEADRKDAEVKAEIKRLKDEAEAKEAKVKADAEAKAKEEEKLKSAPDKEKIAKYLSDLMAVTPPAMSTDKGGVLRNGILASLKKIETFTNQKLEEF